MALPVTTSKALESPTKSFALLVAMIGSSFLDMGAAASVDGVRAIGRSRGRRSLWL